MKEIKLYLIPQPGAKPEFLASLQVVDPSPAVTTLWNDRLPEQVVLEGYTRDSWAWKPSPVWQTITCVSTDGRKKLPGFTGYLKERTKSAYGRFQKSSSCVWVVSYIQSKAATVDPNRVECRIALDSSKIPGCSLSASAAPSASVAPVVAAPKPAVALAANANKRKGGLLGKLVGAQQRTNQHVAIANAPARSAAASGTTTNNNNNNNTNTAAQNGGTSSAPEEAAAADTAAAVPTKTPQQVFADFRQSMQDKMLDFDLSNEQVAQIKVSVNEQAAGMADSDKSKVTMDVLKYMVYEAAEEVNEEWIAFKEPSEFLDEVVINIYKEGAAPPEVMEEINKGEVPDEVRGQQMAIQQERQRQVAYQEQKQKSQVESEALRNMGEDDEEDELEALNTKKRDRRTIEDYEREKRDNTKKSRR
jgi:hypothetical protein